MAQDPAILWEDGALGMIEARDRYTRSAAIEETRAAIKAEFNNRAGTKTILFDLWNHGYVSPLMNDRYAVVWYDTPHGAQIKAFFPALVDFDKKRNSEELGELKKYLTRVAKHESKGKVSLIP